MGLATIVFSTARWDSAASISTRWLQIQLMGVNGAFLTADIFNLFVFFEIALAASYGLLLHGSGRARVGAGLHYIAINLLASSLFLIGVAVLYGITGTLNMADMAMKLPQVPAEDRGLLHAGAAILGIAFLAKAAMWPLNSWLTPAYAAASAPVAALFVLLTKLGIYAALRSWSLLLSTGHDGDGVRRRRPGLRRTRHARARVARHAGRRSSFGASRVTRVIVSSGTLLAVIGFAYAPLAGAALFYLAVSTLAAPRALPALGAGRALARGRRRGGDPRRRDGSRPLYVDFVGSARAATSGRRGSAGGPGHPGDDGLPRPELRRLRAAHRGPAAVLRIPRQVRHDVRAA